MTETVRDLVSELEDIGVRLEVAGESLRAGWPPSVPAESVRPLLARLREHRPEVLALVLQRRTAAAAPLVPQERCPSGHPQYWWLDAGGARHCGECVPSPAQRRMRGVDLDVLAGRSITLVAPAGDLPARGSWALLPSGAVAELVLYEAAGAEVLMRNIQDERLGWFRPEALRWEIDWPWADGARKSVV